MTHHEAIIVIWACVAVLGGLGVAIVRTVGAQKAMTTVFGAIFFVVMAFVAVAFMVALVQIGHGLGDGGMPG